MVVAQAVSVVASSAAAYAFFLGRIPQPLMTPRLAMHAVIHKVFKYADRKRVVTQVAVNATLTSALTLGREASFTRLGVA